MLYIIIYIVKPIPVKFRKSEMRIEGSMAKRLYSIGMPASLSLALPSILISVLNVILADLLGCVCIRAWRVLQAADIPLSASQRSCTGYETAYGL